MNILKKLLKAPAWVIKNRFMLLNRWRFKHVGKSSRIVNPLRIDGVEHIYVGNSVMVQDGTWLAAEPLTGRDVKLLLKDGVTIGHFNHIYATESIVIENDVLTADKVYISDNLHGYEDVDTPIIKQPIKQCNTVLIGEGSWIGENVCIIGASIGKHCVIGANSVVTQHIPDYCVAVGVPARVIKTYNAEKKEWVRVHE